MAWSYRPKQDDDIRLDRNGPTTLNAKSAERMATGGLVFTVYSADGAVDPTVAAAVLTKGSAGAYTLAAPTIEGQQLILTSGSAFAHVVTATGLFNDGVTGGAKNAATFAAFVGATISLIGYNSKWHTVALKAVTVA
jgi:hypothetical protein